MFFCVVFFLTYTVEKNIFLVLGIQSLPCPRFCCLVYFSNTTVCQGKNRDVSLTKKSGQAAQRGGELSPRIFRARLPDFLCSPLQGTCCSRGDGQDELQRSLPTPAILRLCKQSWPVTTLILEACFGLYFESISCSSRTIYPSNLPGSVACVATERSFILRSAQNLLIAVRENAPFPVDCTSK